MDISRTDLGDLIAFCSVVELRSLTKAAATLSETKGAISRRLTRLEANLGITLLFRSPRDVQVTDAGVAFYQHVHTALALLDDANTLARGDAVSPRGRLRITTVSGFALLLTPLIVEFEKRHPMIAIDVDITQEVREFGAYQLDIAMRGVMERPDRQSVLPDSTLIAHRLGASDLMIVASTTYLEERGTPRSTSDLTEHVFVTMPVPKAKRPTELRLWSGRKSAVLKMPRVMTSSCMAFQKELVLAGAGIGLLPESVVANEVESRRLVRLLPSWIGGRVAGYLFHGAGKVLPPKIRLFRDFALDAFRASGRRFTAR